MYIYRYILSATLLVLAMRLASTASPTNQIASRIYEADSILLLDPVYFSGTGDDFHPLEDPYFVQWCPSMPLSEEEMKGIRDSLAFAVEDSETTVDPFIDTVATLAFTTSGDGPDIILSLICEGDLIYCSTASANNDRYLLHDYHSIGRLRCRELFQALLIIMESRSASPNADPTCMRDMRLLSTILNKLLKARQPLENEETAEQAGPAYPPQGVGSADP